MKVPAEEHFPRFTLNDNEQVCWIATYVAAGRWQEIGLLAGQPQSWFLAFARNLKGDAAESINNIFSVLQHVLMAQRKTDFLRTQLEPAFSVFSSRQCDRSGQGGAGRRAGVYGGVERDLQRRMGGARSGTNPRYLHVVVRATLRPLR